MIRGILIILIGILLTACNSYEEQVSQNDGQRCELVYDEEFESSYSIISGEWVSQSDNEHITVYEEQGVYYIQVSKEDSIQSNYDIYRIRTREDEFDIYKGRYIITIECNADEMQYAYTFSYDEEHDILYEGGKDFMRVN